VAKRPALPVALTIAGSDSGGGAGVQADLKTFAAFRVHGTSAITCLTAQNPVAVTRIEPCSPRMLQAQLEAVFAELPPRAIKTGMLFSADLIRVAIRFLLRHADPPLVVDPVMIATSGARLLAPAALRAMERLFLRATVLMPNLDEAQILTGQIIRSIADLREAARALQQRYGCAILAKGGHLRRQPSAVDVLFDGRREWLLASPFVPGVSTHGTGCAYSAAVTAGLARGWSLPGAARRAKAYIYRAIAASRHVGNHFVLHF